MNFFSLIQSDENDMITSSNVATLLLYGFQMNLDITMIRKSLHYTHR